MIERLGTTATTTEDAHEEVLPHRCTMKSITERQLFQSTPLDNTSYKLRLSIAAILLVSIASLLNSVDIGSPSFPKRTNERESKVLAILRHRIDYSNPLEATGSRRYLEEDAEDADAQGGNDDQAQQKANDDDKTDDGGRSSNYFFDDFIQDDLVQNGDDQTVDDFYVFEPDHTPHLFPLSTDTIFGFFVAALAITLGASSGTGGGGTIVPIYILIIGLPIQVAVPIGAVTVLGGSLAATLMNWTRRHPLADRVLIDWDLVLVMEPLTLVGALAGTLLHKILSEKILVVLLVLLLSITAHTTLSKAMRMYRAENRYIRHLRATHSTIKSASTDQMDDSGTNAFPKIQNWGTMDPAEAESLADNNRDHSGNLHSDQHSQRTLQTDNVTMREQETARTKRLRDEEKEEILIQNPDYVTLRSELMEQEKFTPRGKIIALCCMFSVIIFLSLMVGGGKYDSPWDIGCGSTAFWVVHVIMIAFLIGSAWAAQTYVVARHEIKEIVRFDYVHGDIKWDARSAIIYPALFVIAGFFAGTLGIGGGVITVPIILTMGVHPAVVASTSSAMILFTSFASVTTFFVFRLILLDFAVVAFVVGFMASLIGSLVMREVRQARSASGRNFERNSFTAFAIGGVVLVSALMMTIEYVFIIVEQPDQEVDNGGLCEGLRFN